MVHPMGRVTESADKQHQHRPDGTPALVENRGDERRRDGRETDGEREHDEAEQGERSHERVGPPLGVEARERGQENVAYLLADLNRRDVGEIVREVVHAGRPRSEEARHEEVVPAARREGTERTERDGRAERQELARLTQREAAGFEPVAPRHAGGERGETESRARHVSPNDGRPAPTERGEPHRHDGVCDVAGGARETQGTEAQVTSEHALRNEGNAVEEHGERESRKKPLHPGRVHRGAEAIAERKQENESGDAENDVEHRRVERCLTRSVGSRNDVLPEPRRRELIGGHHEHGGNGDLAVLGGADEARDDQRSDQAERARAHAGGDRPQRASNGLSSERQALGFHREAGELPRS